MAQTQTNSALQVQQWSKKVFREYLRENQFSKYMGSDENALIQIVEELSKTDGDRVTVSLVRQLQGSGVSGTQTLRGREESLSTFGHQITVDLKRNGINVHSMEQKKSAIEFLDQGKVVLKKWLMDLNRDAIISAMASPVVDGKTPYASATESQKDAWLAANSDRVLFGATTSNNSSNDHSASLSNVDSTTDKFTGTALSLMKRMAKNATNGGIRPIMTKSGEEWFVVFCNSYLFRDLNTSLAQVHREAAPRTYSENPLFKAGAITYDSCMVIEVPEIGYIDNVGNSNIDVSQAFLCGAQALGYAIGKRAYGATDSWDYAHQNGVSMNEIRGFEKLMFDSVQHGMVTGYFASVLD